MKERQRGKLQEKRRRRSKDMNTQLMGAKIMSSKVEYSGGMGLMKWLKCAASKDAQIMSSTKACVQGIVQTNFQTTCWLTPWTFSHLTVASLMKTLNFVVVLQLRVLCGLRQWRLQSLLPNTPDASQNVNVPCAQPHVVQPFIFIRF